MGRGRRTEYTREKEEVIALGEILKNHRAKYGLSLDAFAAKSGINRTILYNLENKTGPDGIIPTPEAKTMEKIATALGMKIPELQGKIRQKIAYIEALRNTTEKDLRDKIGEKYWPLCICLSAFGFVVEPMLDTSGGCLFSIVDTQTGVGIGVKEDDIAEMHKIVSFAEEKIKEEYAKLAKRTLREMAEWFEAKETEYANAYKPTK